MLDLVYDLIRFFNRPSVQVSDVVTRVGSILSDPGIPLPITIKSMLPGVDEAWLARDPETELPFVLSLKLSAEPGITLGDLKKKLGNFSILTSRPGGARNIIFYPTLEGVPCAVAVIAVLDHDSQLTETSRISEIRFRRDSEK